MDERDVAIIESTLGQSLVNDVVRFLCDREMCTWPIGNRNSSPSEQRELLFDRMCFLLSPQHQRRRRLMIVQVRVLIRLEADAMARSGRARQKSGGGSAVKVINHDVTRRTNLSSYFSACIHNNSFPYKLSIYIM